MAVTPTGDEFPLVHGLRVKNTQLDESPTHLITIQLEEGSGEGIVSHTPVSEFGETQDLQSVLGFGTDAYTGTNSVRLLSETGGTLNNQFQLIDGSNISTVYQEASQVTFYGASGSVLGSHTVDGGIASMNQTVSGNTTNLKIQTPITDEATILVPAPESDGTYVLAYREESAAGFVTLDTQQTITGRKNFEVVGDTAIDIRTFGNSNAVSAIVSSDSSGFTAFADAENSGTMFISDSSSTATGNSIEVKRAGVKNLTINHDGFFNINNSDIDVRLADGTDNYIVSRRIGEYECSLNIDSTSTRMFSADYGIGTFSEISVNTEGNININPDPAAGAVFLNGRTLVVTPLGNVNLLDGTNNTIRSADGVSYDNQIFTGTDEVYMAASTVGSSGSTVSVNKSGRVDINTYGESAYYNDKEISTVATTPQYYTNPTTVALLSSALTSTYPDAPIGSHVQCLSIIGGGVIYEKTATGWATILASVTP